jgi:hypothetical protein
VHILIQVAPDSEQWPSCGQEVHRRGSRHSAPTRSTSLINTTKFIQSASRRLLITCLIHWSGEGIYRYCQTMSRLHTQANPECHWPWVVKLLPSGQAAARTTGVTAGPPHHTAYAIPKWTQSQPLHGNYT